MPIVFYTNEKFDVGSVVDTRKYCELNAEALAQGTEEEREVEAFLEEVRKEHFPEAPDRVCSVLGIPISRMTGRVRREDNPSWFTEIETPEPAGIGVYCYHIAEREGARHLVADEGFVGRLVERWDRVQRRFDKWELANAYWSGKVLRGYSVLIQGPIEIVSECGTPRGSRRLKEIKWEAD